VQSGFLFPRWPDSRSDTLTGNMHFDSIGIMKGIEAVTRLAALAQESRLALFRLLVKRGLEGYTPTQLRDKLSLPGPTLSFHLKELQRAGLIEARRDGRFLFYSPNFPRMNELLGFLTDNCCSLAGKDYGSDCAVPTIEVIQAKRKRA
jgi:ArsR family transcriptional regulator, arsenate/arsenite/antimonite-responsive transcriptional repressor